LILSIAAWSLTYPSSSDPKNIKYVLWKAGIYKLNPDIALATMIGDPDRDRVVLGRTKAQLRKEFGALISPGDASMYLRSCYENSPRKEKDVMFLGPSSWMVVFDHDKATELVLIKGC
jgi:hypothetical protein